MQNIIRLNGNCKAVQYLCQKDPQLSKVISLIGEITYIPYDDKFSFLIEEIIGQMLSNKVANTITSRLKELCNGKITPESISSLSDDEIKSIGTANSKVQYIRCLTTAVQNKELVFDELENLSDEAVIDKLTSIRGIGIWTAKMYLIFAQNRMDILPYEDVAFLQAYEWLYASKDRSKQSIMQNCKNWKPYSSIGARYLYKALDAGLTKKSITT